jgi:hypothetical protein
LLHQSMRTYSRPHSRGAINARVDFQPRPSRTRVNMAKLSASSSAFKPNKVVKSGEIRTLPLILGSRSIFLSSSSVFWATWLTNDLALNRSVRWLKGKCLKKSKVVVLPPLGTPCRTRPRVGRLESVERLWLMRRLQRSSTMPESLLVLLFAILDSLLVCQFYPVRLFFDIE